MKRCDIIEWRRRGFVSWFLGGVLKLFERDWDGWGWHMGIVWSRLGRGCHIMEATNEGTRINYYRYKYLRENTRCYEWLEGEPDLVKMQAFKVSHIGRKYDVAVYFFTAIQYLFRHFVHIRLPLILNDRYSCWELVDEFCDEMGKPWAPKYGFPLLTDFLKAVKETNNEE